MHHAYVGHDSQELYSQLANTLRVHVMSPRFQHSLSFIQEYFTFHSQRNHMKTQSFRVSFCGQQQLTTTSLSMRIVIAIHWHPQQMSVFVESNTRSVFCLENPQVQSDPCRHFRIWLENLHLY